MFDYEVVIRQDDGESRPTTRYKIVRAPDARAAMQKVDLRYCEEVIDAYKLEPGED